MKKIRFSLIFTLVLFLSISAVSFGVKANDLPAVEYQIYPIVHDIEYGDKNTVITDRVNLYAGNGIDQATIDHVYDEFSLLDTLVYLDGAKPNRTKVYLGIYNSGDIADTLVRSGLVTIPKGHFEKIDAHIVAVLDNSIVVLGKDTDAVFYGVTTLGRVFSQVENRCVRQFTVWDYSDTAYRGFIEGYYGFPWSSDNRIELMRFGSQFKTNIYIYAPKDDPYHSANWRGLYTGRDLSDLKEQIEVGVKTKTRFVWSVHPFMDNEQKMTKENYQESYACLIAKFSQLYSLGVRQFVISADDIVTVVEKSAEYGSLHRDLLNDVAEWLDRKGDCYPLVFVPTAYSHVSFTVDSTIDGLTYYDALTDNLDETVEIMWTGDKICSLVSNGRFDDFYRYTRGRKAFMWLNWPVNDFDFSHLVLGKGEPLDYKPTANEELGFTGIVTNPLERAEASKMSIFAVADYCWNLNDFDMDKSYDDSLKYIEPTANTELKEICSHLTSAGKYNDIFFEESEDIKPDGNAFITAFTTGGDVTTPALSLIEKFNYTIACCDGFIENASNKLLLTEIEPWVRALKLTSMASIEYLEVAINQEGLDADKLLEKLENANELYIDATTITVDKLGLPYYTIVKVGGNYLMPFLDEIKLLISDEIYLSAGVYTGNVYKGFGGIELGEMSNITDGDKSTFVWLQEHPYKNSYVRIDLGEVKRISDIEVISGNAAGMDLWQGASVEYSLDGKEYFVAGVLDGETSLIFLDQPTDARYVRIIETDDEHPTWIALKEVSINTNPNITTRLFYENLSAPSENTTILGAIDGDLTTATAFGGKGDYGASITLDLLEVQPVESIRLLMGTESSSNDYFQKTLIEYSTDKATWITVGEYDDKSSLYVTLDSEVSARYIRATQTAHNPKTNWIRVRDFSVNYTYPLSLGTGYQFIHDVTNIIVNDLSRATDGDQATYCWLARQTDNSDYYITLDIGLITDIKSVYIATGIEAENPTTDIISTGTIAVSLDGLVWEDVYNLNDQSGEHQIALAGVTGRYVRIHNTTGSWVALKEFAVNL